MAHFKIVPFDWHENNSLATYIIIDTQRIIFTQMGVFFF